MGEIMAEDPGFIVKFFVKAYKEKAIVELPDAPVASISGVSESDAEDLQKAFGIKTVNDLATNKYVRLAQAITNFSECSGEILNKQFESAEFIELAEKPVHAISGVSNGDADLLAKAFHIKTIRDFADNKYVVIAQTTVALATLVEILLES
jgi:hypothetical protein